MSSAGSLTTQSLSVLVAAFLIVTIVVAAMMALGGWLNLGVGYLNITAFEIAAVGTVFVWLISFIRNVSAAVDDIPELSAVERGAVNP